jgi:hypothetical protein
VGGGTTNGKDGGEVPIVLTFEKARTVVNHLFLATDELMLDDGWILLHEITQEFPGKFPPAERLLNEVPKFWAPPGSKTGDYNTQKLTRIQIIQRRKNYQ